MEFDELLKSAGSLRRGHVCFLPVAPGRMEFAAETRRAILEERPGVVAVELPVTLEAAFLRAVARLPELSVLVYPDPAGADQAVYVPVEPTDPFTEAVRTAVEIGAKVIFLDPALTERPHLPDHYPDPYSLTRIGLEKYIEAYRLNPQPRSPEVEQHAAGIAWKLQGTNPMSKVLAVVSLNLLDPVLDAYEVPQPEPRGAPRSLPVELINPHPDCLAEITTEYPWLAWRYEESRSAGSGAPDRLRVQLEVFREAERGQEENAREKVEHWQRRLLARYTRNLALTAGDLTAGIFDLTVAARSIVDDNYGWEVWNAANSYPPQRAETDIETLSLSGEQIWRNTRRIRLRRRLPRPKQRLRPPNLKLRKKEKTPGEWARQFNGDAICSYPPEDIVVEDYGRFLKRKAKSVLSEERSRVEPFTTSLLDGIDLRETIRNWHEQKIYVRQSERVSGDVGSIVVIFDPDPEGRYNYHTTWLGEHEDESDMAFYSTNPFEHLVGPGIGRAEYGGFMMSYPPRRMIDVWTDPDYDFAETRPERLLLAALDYSIERHVVYVAAKPPRSVFRSIASRLGRNIVYIPIGQLSPQKLKRVRVVHVLDSYARRLEAKEYIW